MKKRIWLLILTVVTFCITGCSSNVNLDLEKIKTDLAELKNNKVERVSMANALFTSDYFKNATDIYDYDLEKYGLTKDYIETNEGAYDFSFAISEDSQSAYFIGKVKDDKLLSELDKYFASYQEVIKEEVEGYNVYIACSDNEKALDLVKDNAFGLLFANLVYIDETLALGIDSELVSEFLIATPMFITNAEQYIILKPTDGNEDKVKESMNKYFNDLQEQWDTYLPSQAELVKNREETKVGSYLVYIVSTDNAKVLDVIKSDKK